MSSAALIALQMGVIKWLVADKLSDIRAQLTKMAEGHDAHTGEIHTLDKRVQRIELHLKLED